MNVKCVGVDVYTNIVNLDIPNDDDAKVYIDNAKPYLRPMSSMTEKERAEMGIAIQKDRIEPYGEIKNCGEDNLLLCTIRQSTNLQDWLNKHHFDYRGLIPMGLGIDCTGLNIYENEKSI
jgi:hypothetical protein